ncbi:MAG: hypothetical protein HKN57_08240 [Xanthomonadales bacterium]|nr:hypothetical protein [Xanthomonadales bacterium]
MKRSIYSNRSDVCGFLRFFIFVAVILLLIAPVPVAADNGHGCKLNGSWIGYSDSGAWWMASPTGQNASHGINVLDVPGFDFTLEGAFPAVNSSQLRGVWERTGGNTFAYTVIGFAVDSNGDALYISKLSGTETILEGCDVMFLENTTLQIYAPNADPFSDDPILDPMDFPNHYGFRMHVDLP